MLFQKNFFTKAEEQSIVQAIGEAEAMTSGEIRLHIEPHCTIDPKERAIQVFYHLKMDATALANGVLIYVAYRDKKFAIIGDKGIHEAVPAHFWDSTKEEIRASFSRGEFFQGILFAIKEIGHQLKSYFPIRKGDKNELPNEISEG